MDLEIYHFFGQSLNVYKKEFNRNIDGELTEKTLIDKGCIWFR